MYKNISKYIIVLILFSIIFLPFFVIAQTESENLVPCGTEKWPQGTYTNATGDKTSTTKGGEFEFDIGNTVKNPCGFDDLLVLVNNVIRFILFKLALPLCAISFAYAGFLLIFSGGNSGKKENAIKIIKNTGIGLVLAAGAWLIVSLLLSILGFDGSWIGFGNVL